MGAKRNRRRKCGLPRRPVTETVGLAAPVIGFGENRPRFFTGKETNVYIPEHEKLTSHNPVPPTESDTVGPIETPKKRKVFRGPALERTADHMRKLLQFCNDDAEKAAALMGVSGHTVRRAVKDNAARAVWEIAAEGACARLQAPAQDVQPAFAFVLMRDPSQLDTFQKLCATFGYQIAVFEHEA